MPNPKYPRGSEWRKWDLQVHTPYSALNNGFGDDFDHYAKILLEQAAAKGIAAIGITDYFSIRGYRELKRLIADRPRLDGLVGAEVADYAQTLLLVPNIELRASVLVAHQDGSTSRINYHVLFAQDIPPETIEEHFLRELHFPAASAPNGRDEFWSLTITNLEELGRRLKEQHANFRDKSDLYVGMMNAVVSHEEVTDVLERQRSRFEDRYLMVVPPDEDLARVNWDSQGHLIRKAFIQKSHMLFSGNPRTREFGLGLKHPSVQDFLNEFRTLKPCVHGSDAHNYKKLFEPDLERYLWLKCDPTFLGLRQLLHEPDDRVFIGKTPPSLISMAARPTRVVSSLAIQKAPGAALKEKWFDCTLPLNGELVAIIGNKGSGKSALADVLGLLGNTPRFKKFSFLNTDKFREPRGNKARHFQASLVWADRTGEGPTRLDQDPHPEAVEKIRYIPQNYLEEICNEVGAGKSSRFYAELQEVIFSRLPESEKHGFEKLDDLLQHRGAEVDRAIKIRIDELREINQQVVATEERLTSRHSRLIESQLQEKRRELAAHDLRKPGEREPPSGDPAAQEQAQAASNALEKGLASLEALRIEIGKLRAEDVRLAKRRTTAEKLLNRLGNLQRQMAGYLAEITKDIEELGLQGENLIELNVNLGPIEGMIKALDEEREAISKSLDPTQADSLEKKRQVLEEEINRYQDALSAPDREYQAYLQEVRSWELKRDEIQGSPESTGSISHLERQLSDLRELPDRLASLIRNRERKVLEIIREKQKLKRYYTTYYGAVQRFLSGHELATADRLKVSLDVAIVQSGFQEKFLEMINQRKTGAFAGVEEGGAEVKKLVDKTNWDSAGGVLQFIRALMGKLQNIEGRTVEIADQLTQGESPQALHDYVFSLEYLSPIYRLTWEGKGLEQLSPGERGNLLLIFYLLVDGNDIPLVIDQPEENLDNQTVVRTLVPCMKDAKKRRQIVMVTHNPNLAVVCDAEQVVYAEIHKDLENEVVYLSGSIEDPIINKKIVDVLEGTRPAFDLRDSKYLP